MDTTVHNILIVDDDIELCTLLAQYLEGADFSVTSVHDGAQAIEHLKSGQIPDAIVLDIMMPRISGLDVLQKIRGFSEVPILMLTGRGDDIDRILGLELGADDYLGKPCNPRELAARLNAVLRRVGRTNGHTQHSGVISFQGLELEPDSLEATANGINVNFTCAEFRILRMLIQKNGTTISKEELTQEVLNRPLTAYDRSIDVHVSRIRQKLNQTGVQITIKTIRGIGYQLATLDK